MVTHSASGAVVHDSVARGPLETLAISCALLALKHGLGGPQFQAEVNAALALVYGEKRAERDMVSKTPGTREPGLYWIREDDSWEVAAWTGKVWHTIGYDGDVDGSAFTEIGERAAHAIP